MAVVYMSCMIYRKSRLPQNIYNGIIFPSLKPAIILARRDECPESYCRTPGVGVGVRVHKNFNLAYNS